MENQITTPFQESSIYNVTMRCFRHVDGTWTYTSKVYFRKNKTKALQIIQSSSMEALLTDTRAFMQTLRK